MRGLKRILIPSGWAVALVLVLVPPARSQSGVPVISGGVGFLGSTSGGATSYQPVIAPVFAAPLGSKFLLESRVDLRGFVARAQGTSGPYQGQFFSTIEYLQLDYLASSHLMLTVGRFLTPFGIFNERLSAVWINKFQEAPYIAAVGTGEGYSNGVMLRGALNSGSACAVNYSAYFSTLSTLNKFGSDRDAGGRLSIFIPAAGFEIGTSYQRRLQDTRINSFGTDLSWHPARVPVDVKGEWAHSDSGDGYWFRTAYRLSQIGGADSVVGRLEPEFRMQQFFRSALIPNDFLPTENTQRPEFGLNYYFPHEIRLNGSYSRQFTARGTDTNIWDFGITYRFLFPLWPGGSK